MERAQIGGLRRQPLAPGMALRGDDEVRTGAGARVYIKLTEGSLVKLGENASLRILDLAPGRGGFFKAALHVLEGAFRFTTDLLAAQRRRQVSIRVATITAGIRGTDLWGKSSPERETDIAHGRGAARRGGRWKMTLARADTQGEALEVYDRLRNAGYAA